MNLKKVPSEIKIYGGITYRDKKCPTESLEQITFISIIRREYPAYGAILIHPKNEGRLVNGQFDAISKDKAMGMTKGASDIIIPGSPSFVCELKRRDITLSKIEDDQIDYLLAAQKCGAFACIALGYQAALEAFNDWIDVNNA